MMEIKKILAVSIIFLFIGVAVAPSFNQSVVTASTDDDLVEVTSQACGIKGYGDTTVKLTREQYQNLEQYLVEFRARLNQTTTREEAIPIFKEAVVELDTYGLLPRGMSVERAQKLVTCSTHASSMPGLLRRILSFYQPLDTMIVNAGCLIAGQTTSTCFRGMTSNLLYEISRNVGHRNLSILLWLVSMYLDLFRSLNPICLGNRMYLGYDNTDEILMASGWVTTIGVLGIQKTPEGMTDMIGSLSINPYYYSFGPFPSWVLYPAVVGFIGIKIFMSINYPHPINDYSYLGSAIWVEISLEPPAERETI